MIDLTLDGLGSFAWAYLVDGSALENVTLVRATGYDTRLFVKGTYNGKTNYAPMDNVVRLVTK